MELAFIKVSGFERGTLLRLLEDAYGYDPRNGAHWAGGWREFDDFFYDNLPIADRCGFVTALGGQAIGFASWDPRPAPNHVIFGHNCIATRHKGNGYGRAQLGEAVRRIAKEGAQKIIVTTNERFSPAMRMYEGAGFVFKGRRANPETGYFAGDLIDYEYLP